MLDILNLAHAAVFTLGGLVAFLRDGFTMLHEVGVLARDIVVLKFAYPIFGSSAFQYTVGMEGSVLLMAGGALMGLRVAASVMLGSILCWVVLVPQMHRMGVIETLDYRTMVSWSLWAGAACMVTSGLLAFAFQWRAVARALSGLTALIRPRTGPAQDPELEAMERIEVPPSWFASGAFVGTLGVVWIAHLAFAMPVWMGLLAVILSFFLALVACRVTGETDTTPVGAMGKVTQLMYGAITPHSMRVNAPMQTKRVHLMAARITSAIPPTTLSSPMAGLRDCQADLLMGTGGVVQGLLAPCASGRDRVVPRPLVSSEARAEGPAALAGGRPGPRRRSRSRTGRPPRGCRRRSGRCRSRPSARGGDPGDGKSRPPR